MEDMILTNGEMPTSTPEAQGVSSQAVINFFNRIQKEDIELHSIQIVRNGSLIVDAVAAPYTKNSFHRIFSAAKGVVATGMMFAVQEGYYKLDDLVVPKLPREWIPEDLDERWNRLTIYHLLTMNTGHDCDTLFQMWGKADCWIKRFFEVRPAYEQMTKMCREFNLAPHLDGFEKMSPFNMGICRFILDENEVNQQEIGFNFQEGEVEISSVWNHKKTDVMYF